MTITTVLPLRDATLSSLDLLTDFVVVLSTCTRIFRMYCVRTVTILIFVIFVFFFFHVCSLHDAAVAGDVSIKLVRNSTMHSTQQPFDIGRQMIIHLKQHTRIQIHHLFQNQKSKSDAGAMQFVKLQQREKLKAVSNLVWVCWKAVI